MDNNMNGNVPGKGAATCALACGLVSLVLGVVGPYLGGLTGNAAVTWIMIIAPIVLGIVAIVMSSQAKKQGFVGGIATGGLVLGILGVVFGGLWLACVAACAATVFGVKNELGI